MLLLQTSNLLKDSNLRSIGNSCWKPIPLKLFLLIYPSLSIKPIGDFLKETNSYTPEHIYNLNTQSEMHGGNTYDQYTKDELGFAYENHSDLLCYKLYKVSNGIDFHSIKPLYVDLETLLKMRGKIWVNQNSYAFTKNGLNQYLQAENMVELVYSLAQTRP